MVGRFKHYVATCTWTREIDVSSIGIFATDGKLWHDSRQLIRPQFVKDRVSDLACFERHIVALLPLLSGNGQATDVKDLFFRFE